MTKWYEETVLDNSPIISSRIRLARNLKKYPFSIKINEEQSKELTEDIKNSIINERSYFGNEFKYIDFNKKSYLEQVNLFEKHLISTNFIKSKRVKGLLLSNDEKISIMINEEDHVRLQTVMAGDKLDEAYILSNKIDDFMEESLEYAFHKDFGYLTTCPTNIGTGLRASYMVHLPMLGNSPQLPTLIDNIGKFGMTVRGIFGEGTSPIGNFFQISNQVTIGRTENDILGNLKTITNQIIESENNLNNSVMQMRKIDWEDKSNRAVGILQNARQISLEESMKLLSDVKVGLNNNLIDKKFSKNFYEIIINIRSANIQLKENKELSEKERNIVRANYLREIFN